MYERYRKLWPPPSSVGQMFVASIQQATSPKSVMATPSLASPRASLVQAAGIALAAVKSFPHAEAIQGIEDARLRGATLSVVAAQRTSESSRLAGAKAVKDAVVELNEQFSIRSDERLEMKAILVRQSKVLAKSFEAQSRLNSEVTDFIGTVIEVLRAADARRTADARSAESVLYDREKLWEKESTHQREARSPATRAVFERL